MYEISQNSPRNCMQYLFCCQSRNREMNIVYYSGPLISYINILLHLYIVVGLTSILIKIDLKWMSTSGFSTFYWYLLVSCKWKFLGKSCNDQSTASVVKLLSVCCNCTWVVICESPPRHSFVSALSHHPLKQKWTQTIADRIWQHSHPMSGLPLMITSGNNDDTRSHQWKCRNTAVIW